MAEKRLKFNEKSDKLIYEEPCFMLVRDYDVLLESVGGDNIGDANGLWDDWFTEEGI